MSDGPLLADWLTDQAGGNRKRKRTETVAKDILECKITRKLINIKNIHTKISCFEREMVARANNKASASRMAAKNYHCPSILKSEFSVEGIPPTFTEAIKNHKSVGAWLGEDLDKNINNLTW